MIQGGGVAQEKPHSQMAVYAFLFPTNAQINLALSENKKANAFALAFLGRDDWIRTSDHLHPMQVRYQAAPHPELIFTQVPSDSPFFNF